MRKIRQSVFETNSSSTHSFVVCTNKEYNDFKNDKVYLIKEMNIYGCGKESNDLADELRNKSQFATAEEVKEIFYLSPELKRQYDEAIEEGNLDTMLAEEYYIYSYDSYDDYICDCCFENIEYSFTSPAGEKLVLFGYVGYDG